MRREIAKRQAFPAIALTTNLNDKPILIDVRGFFDSEKAAGKGLYYRTL